MRRNYGKIRFEDYNMNQLTLPMDLNVMIPEKHLVGVINNTIERMSIEPLLKLYKGGGTSCYRYHTRSLTQVMELLIFEVA